MFGCTINRMIRKFDLTCPHCGIMWDLQTISTPLRDGYCSLCGKQLSEPEETPR